MFLVNTMFNHIYLFETTKFKKWKARYNLGNSINILLVFKGKINNFWTSQINHLTLGTRCLSTCTHACRFLGWFTWYLFNYLIADWIACGGVVLCAAKCHYVMIGFKKWKLRILFAPPTTAIIYCWPLSNSAPEMGTWSSMATAGVTLVPVAFLSWESC